MFLNMMSQVRHIYCCLFGLAHLNSPVISDPAFLQALGISPSPHLLLIPSLLHSIYTTSLSLVLCQIVLSFLPSTPVFVTLYPRFLSCPVLTPASLFSDLEFLPAPCLVFVAYLTDFLVLTLPVPDIEYTFFKHWLLPELCFWVLICTCDRDSRHVEIIRLNKT